MPIYKWKLKNYPLSFKWKLIQKILFGEGLSIFIATLADMTEPGKPIVCDEETFVTDMVVYDEGVEPLAAIKYQKIIDGMNGKAWQYHPSKDPLYDFKVEKMYADCCEDAANKKLEQDLKMQEIMCKGGMKDE